VEGEERHEIQRPIVRRVQLFPGIDSIPDDGVRDAFLTNLQDPLCMDLAAFALRDEAFSHAEKIRDSWVSIKAN